MRDKLRSQTGFLPRLPAQDRCHHPIEISNSHGDGTTLILGAARSGTTWLAKIFDAHPDVLYRHEPDIIYRADRLAKSLSCSENTACVDCAREYLNSLAAVRTVKAAGSFPVFSKRYRSGLARALRTGLILGMRGAEMAVGDRQSLSQTPIPDLKPDWRPSRIVIKSVSLLAHVGLFAKAWPESRIIVIVRHPCGQVASFMRGIELGKFVAEPLGEIADSDEAERLGLRIKHFSALSTVEQLAWKWAFSNQKMLHDISGLNRVNLIGYEELAADPLGTARDLFAFAALSWDAQVERFIKNSTLRHRTRYYGVARNPLYAANRWRDILAVDDQQRISTIASRVAIGRAFFMPSPHARLSHLEAAVPSSSGPIPEGTIGRLPDRELLRPAR